MPDSLGPAQEKFHFITMMIEYELKINRRGDIMAALTISHLETLTLKEIYAMAREYKVSYYAKLTKKELIFAILKAQAEKDGYLFIDGMQEIIPCEGCVFLRPINYSTSTQSIYM